MDLDNVLIHLVEINITYAEIFTVNKFNRLMYTEIKA